MAGTTACGSRQGTLRLLLSLASLLVACQDCPGVGSPCTLPDPERDGGECGDAGTGCYQATGVYLNTGNPDCVPGLCLVTGYDGTPDSSVPERNQHRYCTCRCGVPAALAGSQGSLCTCPTGFSCVSLAGPAYPAALQGSYCVRSDYGRPGY